MEIKFKHYALIFLLSAVAGIWITIRFWGLGATDLFFLKARFLHSLLQDYFHLTINGRMYKIELIAQSREFDEYSVLYWKVIIATLLISSLVTYIFHVFVGGRKKLLKNETRVRGTEILSASKLKNHLKNEPYRLTIGGIPYPTKLETQGLLFVGSTGSGKSSGINELLSQIRPLGEKMIVVDPGGEYLQKFARTGDILLNPFDDRSANWTPFTEIKNKFDIDTVVRQLVPDSEGHSREWTSYTQTFFGSAFERICEAKPKFPLTDLIFRFTKCNREQLKSFFSYTPAAKYFEKGSEGILGSVDTILAKHIKNLSKLDPKGTFSIRDWIRSDSKNWLFITYQADNRAALEDLIATWIAVAGNEVLTLPTDLNRRIWLAFDEFPRVGKVQNFAEILTNGRKNGLAAIVGMQTTSQIQKLYGREEAETLLSCLNSVMILKNSDPATADMMSKMLGQSEVERKTVNENSKKQQSTSTTRAITPAVLPSEILGLPGNVGYLKVAGQVTKTQLPILQFPKRVEPYVPNPRFNLIEEDYSDLVEADLENSVVSADPTPPTEQLNPSDADRTLSIFGG